MATMAARHDALIDEIAGGRHAALIAASLRHRISAREDMILRELVAAHRDGKVTDVQLRAGIAGISELRLLLSTLERESLKGQAAAQREFGT